MNMHLAAKIPPLGVANPPSARGRALNHVGITCDFRLDMRNFISQSASLFSNQNINFNN